MKTTLPAAVVLLALLACQNKNEPTATSIPFTPSAPMKTAATAAVPLSSVPSYADAVARVESGVVTIRAARHLRQPQRRPIPGDRLPGNRRYRDFFDPMPEDKSPGEAGVRVALGSGVIVQLDGTVVTNHHVIDGAEEIKVELTNHRAFDAKIIGTDRASDLAVLKIDATNLGALTLGDSDRVRVGDIALAIGNPLGIGQTVTAGIISAKGRSTGLSDGSFEDFLQTDAPINQGNSGGALINIKGELIGINSQILSASGGSIGIGFAIPSNMVRNVMEQLLKTGKVHRGWLGVEMQPLTAELASSFGLSEIRGVLVNSVTANGPAARAGMHRGDVILALDERPVADGNAIRNRVARTVPGTDVILTIVRNRYRERIRVTLGEYQRRGSCS